MNRAEPKDDIVEMIRKVRRPINLLNRMRLSNINMKDLIPVSENGTATYNRTLFYATYYGRSAGESQRNGDSLQAFKLEPRNPTVGDVLENVNGAGQAH